MTQDAIRRRTALGTLAGLLPFMAPYRGRFLLAGIALLVAAGATLVIPVAFRQMIDLGFVSGAASMSTCISLPCSRWPACWRWPPPPASTWCPGWASG